jgi:hypothetical protein
MKQLANPPSQQATKPASQQASKLASGWLSRAGGNPAIYKFCVAGKQVLFRCAEMFN